MSGIWETVPENGYQRKGQAVDKKETVDTTKIFVFCKATCFEILLLNNNNNNNNIY